MQPSLSQSSDDTSNSAPLNPNNLEIIDYDNNNNNNLPTPRPPITQLAQPVQNREEEEEKRQFEPEATVTIEDQNGNFVEQHGKKRSKDEIDSNDSEGDWDDIDIVHPEDYNKQRRIIYFTRETTARLAKLKQIADRIVDRGQKSTNGAFIQDLSNLATDVQDRIKSIKRGSRIIPKNDEKLIKFIEEKYLNINESDLNNNNIYNTRTPSPPSNSNNNNNNNRNLPHSVSQPTSQPSKNFSKKPTIPTKPPKPNKTRNSPPKTGTSSTEVNSSDNIDTKFGAYQRFGRSNNAKPINATNSNIFNGSSDSNQQSGAAGGLTGINLNNIEDLYKNIDKKEVREYLAKLLATNGGNSNNINGTGGSGSVNPPGSSIANSNDNAGVIANLPDNS